MMVSLGSISMRELSFPLSRKSDKLTKMVMLPWSSETRTIRIFFKLALDVGPPAIDKRVIISGFTENGMIY